MKRGKSKKEPREAGLTIYLVDEENSDQCSDEIFANICNIFAKNIFDIFFAKISTRESK